MDGTWNNNPSSPRFPCAGARFSGTFFVQGGISRSGSRLATYPISGCAFGKASRLGDGRDFFRAGPSGYSAIHHVARRRADFAIANPSHGSANAALYR